MASNPSLRALLDGAGESISKALMPLLEGAYCLGRLDGIEEGRNAARETILNALNSAPVPAGTTEEVIHGDRAPPSAMQNSPARRAPKGLTQQYIDQIIEERRGLSAKQIANLAVQMDPRISPKTVYNILLGNDRYMQKGEGWHFSSDSDFSTIGFGNGPAKEWYSET